MPELNRSNKIKERGLNISQKGHLEFDGCNLSDLAQHYGTPCYVYSEKMIRGRCQEYIQSFKEENVEFEVIYASKAFLVQALCHILKEEGMSLDASSGGEIYIALSAGFPSERIYFHGNNKSENEIKLALEKNIGTIMVDNIHELNMIDNMAGQMGKKIHIMLRIIPGVDTHTHAKIRTGQVDSKFGVPIAELENVMAVLFQKKNLIYKGLHCHIGSQLLEVKYHLLALEEMVQAMKSVEENFHIRTENLNIGGGLGVKYTDLDNPVPIQEFVNQIVNRTKELCEYQNLHLPKLMIEPGRSIVAEAGITLYQVGAIKEIQGLRKYVLVDGGMADNPRPSLYDAKYEALIINKYDKDPEEHVTIAGKFCESGDILIQNIQLPGVKSGDLLVFFSTGAYHFAMSNNYNGIPRPPVVLVHNGQHGMMVKGETYQDLVRNHAIPEWFPGHSER